MLASSISKSLEPPVEGIWKEDSEKSWSREDSEMSGKWRMLISATIFERVAGKCDVNVTRECVRGKPAQRLGASLWLLEP